MKRLSVDRPARTVLIVALCWLVSATPLRVIDGDTFTATLPIWLGLTATETIRVLGVNTPERKGPARPAGEAAKAFTERWLQEGTEIAVRVCERDSFGRVLGRVTRRGLAGTEGLAEALLGAGHAVPYLKP